MFINIRVLRLPISDWKSSLILTIMCCSGKYPTTPMESVVLFASPFLWRRSGLMVSILVTGLSGTCFSPGQGHCIVFLGRQDTLLSQYPLSTHPGV